jgi:hypothetical protein
LPEFKANGFALFTRLEKINAVHIYGNLNHTILHYFRRLVEHAARMRAMRNVDEILRWKREERDRWKNIIMDARVMLIHTEK